MDLLDDRATDTADGRRSEATTGRLEHRLGELEGGEDRLLSGAHADFACAIIDAMRFRVDASAPRIADEVWRTSAEGSSLIWDADASRLTYISPTRNPRTGWSLPVGEQVGEVARVVHVRGDLPYSMTGLAVVSVAVDHYAFLSADGALLVPGIATGQDGYFSGWYPPARVFPLIDAAGVPHNDDVVSDWADLHARYPRLVPTARLQSRMAAFSAVFFTLLGVFFCAMGVLGTVLAITVDRIGILLALLALPTGIYLLWVGPRFNYRVSRRLARRRGHADMKHAAADDTLPK